LRNYSKVTKIVEIGIRDMDMPEIDLPNRSGKNMHVRMQFYCFFWICVLVMAGCKKEKVDIARSLLYIPEIHEKNTGIFSCDSLRLAKEYDRALLGYRHLMSKEDVTDKMIRKYILSKILGLSRD